MTQRGAVEDDFELRLIDALQPIRGFALAQGIYHLFISGLFDELTGGRRQVKELAAAQGMDVERVCGFLRFLANEDLVALRDGATTLTARGHALAEFRPWYELLVGGYAQTFQQITAALGGSDYASRDGRQVGVGSCGISQYDAVPMVRELLFDLPVPVIEVIDLGCGDGEFLTELIRDRPEVRAVGVDPFAPERSDGRLNFRRTSALDYLRSSAYAGAGGSARLFVAAFLLQEILEQDGPDAVIELIRLVLRDGAHLVVVEVDHRPEDPAVMRHGLGAAYYNPYYLLHVITRQRLETTAFWLDLFSQADAVVVGSRTVDARVDSTGLELGWLLRGR